MEDLDAINAQLSSLLDEEKALQKSISGVRAKKRELQERIATTMVMSRRLARQQHIEGIQRLAESLPIPVWKRAPEGIWVIRSVNQGIEIECLHSTTPKESSIVTYYRNGYPDYPRICDGILDYEATIKVWREYCIKRRTA